MATLSCFLPCPPACSRMANIWPGPLGILAMLRPHAEELGRSRAGRGVLFLSCTPDAGISRLIDSRKWPTTALPSSQGGGLKSDADACACACVILQFAVPLYFAIKLKPLKSSQALQKRAMSSVCKLPSRKGACLLASLALYMFEDFLTVLSGDCR